MNLNNHWPVNNSVDSLRKITMYSAQFGDITVAFVLVTFYIHLSFYVTYGFYPFLATMIIALSRN